MLDNNIAIQFHKDQDGQLIYNNIVENNIVYSTHSTQTCLYQYNGDLCDVSTFNTKDADIRNNIAGNPLFVDFVNRDYHLQSGSPAIDAGVLPEESARIDYEGNTIPQAGTAADIGIYEYQGSSSYTVTFQTDETAGASISGSTSQTVDANSSCTAVTANASAGYYFVNWTGTNGFVSTVDNPLTVTNVTSNMSITANYEENGNILSNKISNSINIDGTLESEWDNATVYTFTNANTDNEVTSRVLWDDTYLYLSFSVEDNVLDASGSNIWENDAVEIFFDPNNNKSTVWDTETGHKQFLMDINSNKLYIPDTYSSEVETGINTNATDYSIEIRISWDALGVSPSTGTIIGFDMANDDKDGSASAFQYTYTGRVTNFADPSLFAAIELVGEVPIDGSIISNKISNSINIDGILESEWDNTTAYTFTNANTDNEVTSRVLWDDVYLYLSFSVEDNVLDASGSNIWENDAVEMFFDPNNNKSTVWDTETGHKQFLMDINSNKLYIPDTYSSEVETGINTNTTDYSVEIRISWDALGVSPSTGTIIGFDMANDDKDGSANAFQYTYTGRVTNFADPSLFTELVLAGLKSTKISTSTLDQEDYSIKSISLYPNPTTGLFTVDGDDIQGVEIFDMMGKKCELVATLEVNRRYDLSNLTEGIYFVRISKDMGEVITKKIILRK